MVFDDEPSIGMCLQPANVSMTSTFDPMTLKTFSAMPTHNYMHPWPPADLEITANLVDIWSVRVNRPHAAISTPQVCVCSMF